MTEPTPRKSAHRSRLKLCLLGPALLCGALAQAQTLRPSPQLSLAAPAAARSADFIVVLVNAEPITNSDVRQRLLRIEQQLSQQGRALPARAQLAADVLEQLINERAQLQHAAALGIRADPATLAQAEQSIAAQNRMSVPALHRQLAADGIDIRRFHDELRTQIVLRMLQEREIAARVRVSESEIDDALRERQPVGDGGLELNLAHVLVRVPQDTAADHVQALQARAQNVAERARTGADFAALALEFSDAPERVRGGEFGLRPADRLPELFVQATRALPVGAVVGPLRSSAGFHILKVLEKQQAGRPDVLLTETRASHILLLPSAQLSPQAALDQLGQWRQRIISGQDSFEALARAHSQDGSAPQGGDLGWARPGQFVPEFEQAMNMLRPGEISAPLVSRFGVHLIRVDERRQGTLSEREQREIVREQLHEEKAEQALIAWAQDVRGRAFVEQREAPQP